VSRIPASLNLLRTFDAAARHLSFTLAGQELCITASAVSQQMRSLEEQLGLRLFERKARALSLTPAGEQYWRAIAGHLQGIDASTRALMSGQTRAPLRVSLMPPMASRVVLPNLADFQARFPDIELRLDASLRNLDLARDEADMAIRFGTPPWAGCQHEKLLDLYVQPVCPPAMAEAHALRQHPENLSRLPLIQMTERPDAWRRYLAMAGLGEPQGQQEYFVDDYPAAIEAAQTLGVALAILPLEQPLLDSDRLAAPWPPLGPMPEAVYAVVRDQALAREDVACFSDWLKQQLAALPAVNAAPAND
jgi:LysR family glycine cleavage system transcriptional activator